MPIDVDSIFGFTMAGNSRPAGSSPADENTQDFGVGMPFFCRTILVRALSWTTACASGPDPT